ncbi:hypothetical protein DL93DRAFT_2122332 [Clavulina sp. PMI_390]|nr:hypothetical protein DL93DRAFT_2122332 [Clavulina sp. PMI_390]
MSQFFTPAEEQFHTSSQYPIPQNWKGPTFKIRNDYPAKPDGITFSHDIWPTLPGPEISVISPWLNIDFKEQPLEYAQTVLEYCWEGNTPADFNVWDNKVRNWYHAPWMHASANGREPLKGLTYERSIPPAEFASTQTHALQNWAVGFYNDPGAVTFGQAWANPNAPVWNTDLKFHPGTCVFKLLLTTASDEQVPTMKGAPEWRAVISPQPNPAVAPSSGAERNDFDSGVRLIQVDWAVVDHRSPIGWVFGTWMYNGYLTNVSDPWRRLTSVGVMWGSDPELTQAAVNSGKKPEESWINPEAEKLRISLGGGRPSWGYNGRLNGPADNFVSACTSCHATAQSYAAPMVQDGKLVKVKRDNTEKFEWVPRNEKLTMTWFENVKAGESFSVRGALSCDYSLQFLIGWNNYNTWLKTQKAQQKESDPKKRVLLSLPGRRIVFKPQDPDTDEETVEKMLENITIIEEPMRAGPPMKWV